MNAMIPGLYDRRDTESAFEAAGGSLYMGVLRI